MINPKNFTNILNKNGINFYTGVPDSLMKSFCNYIEGKKNHISSVSEGSAIGIGIGYHLATGKIPLIYFQNSGIGNIVNPIISLVNKKVFNIPLLLLVGWRGETFNKRMNVTDEPQHRYQGLVTEKILKLLQIKYKILNKNSNYSSEVKKLITYSRKKSQPVALLVRKGSFLKIKKKKFNKSNLLKRRQILKIITDNLSKNTSIVSTTGVLSRELMEIDKTNNFYCVGGMGHAISIANGIALKINKKILCLDGDGSALMHLGSQIYSEKSNNLIHILINNGVHDSVGGQKIAGENIKFHKIASYLGYQKTFLCRNKKDIIKFLNFSIKNKKSTFLEILSSPGYEKNLRRPEKKMTYYKKRFMKGLIQ